MAEDTKLDVIDYLDRFFEEVRNEARANPAFASRLAKAMGGQVVFEDATKGDIANPYLAAADGNKAQFYAVFSTMTAAQLKKLMKSHNLATPVDMRGKSASALIDLMYERAINKVGERKSSAFKSL